MSWWWVFQSIIDSVSRWERVYVMWDERSKTVERIFVPVDLYLSTWDQAKCVAKISNIHTKNRNYESMYQLAIMAQTLCLMSWSLLLSSSSINKKVLLKSSSFFYFIILWLPMLKSDLVKSPKASRSREQWQSITCINRIRMRR